MRYFDDVKTSEEAKTRYRDLAKRYHPDLGGCSETMKVINEQYAQTLEGSYQREGKSITEIEELLKNDILARDALNRVLHLPDVTAEICGSWVWITGNTKPLKEPLKQAGFLWSSNKKRWYYSPTKKKLKKWFNKWSMQDIRNRYGSTQIDKPSPQKLR